ncbi:MAG TPA: helix-turn-helix domain-containing protein, partial [Nitrospiraceae bacterium]|nr:helix-turn-helix domain-containing protein [Nitrospiraceae bacterium]
TIAVPPLRERVEDIPMLAQSFVQKYGTAKEKPVTGISPDAIALLCQYSWPGNVRELEHAIERAVALTPHSIILPDDLPQEVKSAAAAAGNQGSGWMTLEDLERNYILRALETHQRDFGRTAEVLGIHRKTLQRKLRRYGLSTSPASGTECSGQDNLSPT